MRTNYHLNCFEYSKQPRLQIAGFNTLNKIMKGMIVMDMFIKKDMDIQSLDSEQIINLFSNDNKGDLDNILQGALIHQLMRLEGFSSIEEVSKKLSLTTKHIAKWLRDYLDATIANVDSHFIVHLMHHSQMDDIMIGFYIHWLMQLHDIKSQREFAKKIEKSPAFVSSRLKAFRENVEQRRGRPSHTAYNLDQLAGEDIPLRVVSKVGNLSSIDLARLLKRACESFKRYNKDIPFEKVYQNQVIYHTLDFGELSKGQILLRMVVEKTKLDTNSLRKAIKESILHFGNSEDTETLYSSLTRAYRRGQSAVNVKFESLRGSQSIIDYIIGLIKVYWYLEECESDIKDFYQTIQVEDDEKTSRGRHRYMSIDLTKMVLMDEHGNKVYIPLEIISKEGNMPKLDLILLLNEAYYRLIQKSVNSGGTK